MKTPFLWLLRSVALPPAAVGVLMILGAHPAAAQNLSVQNGLSLWLKADVGVTTSAGGAVLEWQDQSGQGNHAYAVLEEFAPRRVEGALNNRPVLRFDGMDDYLEIPDADSLSLEGDLTSFFVVRFDDFATYRAVWGKTAANYPAPTDYYTMPKTGVPRLLRGDGSPSSLASVDGTVPLRVNTYLIVGFDINGTTATHYLAAQPNGSREIEVFTYDADTSLIIGSREDLFTKMKGDIAEVLLYDRALSASEREAVVAYLGQKYGIQNLPPTITLSTNPAGPSVPEGQTVMLTANAADPDGTLARVDFFANGLRVATAVAPPYQVALTLTTPGSYTFTARAVDDDEGFADAAPVTLNATGSEAPELSVTRQLSLWLKADAGITLGDENSVQSWNDQSGQNNHVMPRDEFTAPTWVEDGGYGLPVVRFDGFDDLLEAAHTDSLDFTEGFTTFFAVRMEDFATFRAVWAKTIGNLPAPVDFYAMPGSGILRFYTGDGATISFMDGQRPLQAGATQIVGVARWGNTVRQYLNGQPNGAGTTSAPSLDLGMPLTIGTRDNFETQLLGDLAELLIYQTELTEAEAQSVQAYLAARHHIPLVAVANAVPVVAVTQPAPGTTLTAPAEVTLAATASDADGSVSRVEFLVNGTVVAADDTAPYEATVTLSAPGPQVLTVRAIDNLGAAGVSPPVTISLTSDIPPPLPAFAYLSLWLRADQDVTVENGVVSAWQDQSVNLNHAAQPVAAKRPQWVENELNGHPVLRFDGEDDELVAASSASLANTGPISSFFVVRFEDFATYRAVWGKTVSNLPCSTDYYLMPNSGLPRLFRGGPAGNAFLEGAYNPEPGEFYILGFEHDGEIARHYFNGEVSAEGPLWVELVDEGNPLIIGSRSDGVTRLFGDLAELVIYNTVLSDAGRMAVIDYLAEKYDILVTHTPTEAPVLSFSVSGSTITLSWPAEVLGWRLQQSHTLAPGSWFDVPNVVNNSVTLPVEGAAFFRLSR